MNSKIAILLFVSAICSSVFAHEENENNYLQELVDAGVSEETGEGIIVILQKHQPDATSTKTSGEIFQEIIDDTDKYVKTRPQADQDAYNAFVAAKKTEYGQPDQE